MSIDYSKLENLLNLKGESYNSLKSKKIISDYAMRQLQGGLPTSLKYIDGICQYFNVPIEEVVEIKLEDEPSGSDSTDQ